MATYLPKDTSPGSAYQEGGGLYALGLIHANHGGDIIDYLLSQLKNASNDVRSLAPLAKRRSVLKSLYVGYKRDRTTLMNTRLLLHKY